MIELKNIKKYYNNTLILDIKSFKLPDYGLYFICGDSGCGKSTLLNLLAGFDKDYKGLYLFNNKVMKNANIAYVNQKNILFASELVKDNILYCANNKNINIDALLLKFHLSLTIKNKLASSLSGGEKARVCLIMNLLKNPDILLCDEVTAGLDEESAKMVFDILKNEAKRRLVICVTHNLELANKYADKMYFIKDGMINNDLRSKCKIKQIKEKRKIFKTKTLISIIKHKLELKKIRTILCTTLLSIGLVSFCMSILISSAIKDNLQNTFATFLNKDSIIMKNKVEGNYDLVDFSFLDYQDMVNDYPEFFESVSAYYLNNIDSLFDTNDIYLKQNDNRFLLTDFSLFSINNYEHINEHLENDEIILGINDLLLRNINMFIKQKFTSFLEVNQYLSTNDLFYEINVSKKEWQYSDKVLFKIKKVFFSDKPTIFHSNRLFNEYILEDLMRFKDKETSIKDLPWLLDKQYYLNAYDGKEFIRLSEYDNNFAYKIPDYFLNSFNKIVFKYSNIPNISLWQINEILKNVDVKELRLGNDATYMVIPDSMVSGFARDFVLSKDETVIEDLIEINSCININSHTQYPKEVAFGNITNISNNNFNFSSNISEDIKQALKYDDLVISSALAKHLKVQENEYINAIFLHHFEIKENKMLNYYKKSKLKIKSIIENSDRYIYQKSNWINVYFRDYFNVSNYDLIIKNVEIQLKDSKKTEEEIVSLNKANEKFEFFNTTGDLTNTIDQVLNIAEKVLLFFSFFTITLSIIMFMLVVYLFMQENINDFITIYALGGTTNDVKKFKFLYIYFLLKKAIGSTIISILGIAVAFNMAKVDILQISIMNIAQLLIRLIPLLVIILLIFLLYIQKTSQNEKKIAKFLSFYK